MNGVSFGVLTVGCSTETEKRRLLRVRREVFARMGRELTVLEIIALAKFSAGAVGYSAEWIASRWCAGKH